MYSRANKIDFISKLTQDITKGHAYPSYYSFLRRFAWLGVFSGVLPIQNFLSSSTTPLRIKRFSWLYLYSIIMLLSKFLALTQIALTMQKFNDSIKTKNMTDYYAGSLAFIFTFCFGPFAHVLCLWKLQDFVEMLKSIELYDVKHDVCYTEIKVGKPKPKLGLLLINSFLLALAPVLSFYQIVRNHENPQSLHLTIIPGYLSTSNLLLICFCFVIMFSLLELGPMFINIQIFTSSWLINLRLEHIISIVHTKYELEHSNKNTLSTIGEISSYSLNRSWESIGAQYIDFLCMYKKYKGFIGHYFTILFGGAIISITCMLYHVLTADGQVARANRGTFAALIIFSIVKLYGYTYWGQKFQAGHRQLVMEIMYHYQKQSYFQRSGKTQMKRIIKLVTGSKLNLSASGYFIVERKNITSIVSVIITYIVVLFQISNTDTEGYTKTKVNETTSF